RADRCAICTLSLHDALPISLDVVDHPMTGPVFSGPHLEPFVCTTEEHGLGPATDDDCSAPTVVRWSYVNGAGELVPLDDPATPPDRKSTRLNSSHVKISYAV